MNSTHRLVLILVCAWFSPSLTASDACENRAVETEASVTVSDGSSFDTRSFFQSAHFSAIEHIRDEHQLVSVEGPLSWVSRGDKVQLGDERLKRFALGHQFHAMLLYFDEIVAGDLTETEVSFNGRQQRARGGKYPHGGGLFLVEGADNAPPAGLVMKLPGIPPMEISFDDWRTQEEQALPFKITIDDGTRVFEYSYTDISITQQSPYWYLESVNAPALDTVQVHRLHRRLLAAHCAGDADTLADHSTIETTVANRGSLQTVSREDMRERFSSLFAGVDYHHYEDIVSPVIEVAESGDVGWIAVNVRTMGETADSQNFDYQWSWIMTVRKVDGQWLNAGNASNMRTP